MWELAERPGYFGKRRDELTARWNEEFGPGKWRITYQWGSQVIPRPLALQMYEDGYYEFLKARPDTLAWIVTNFSEVYDTAVTNVQAGFNYDHPQDTQSNHVHDISIRRSVARLGQWFTGDRLLEVRSKSSEGAQLSPGFVPFHLPHMIYTGDDVKNYRGKPEWWQPRSIEDFYQRNKRLERYCTV